MERFGEISELKAKIGYLGFVVFKKGLYVQTDRNQSFIELVLGDVKWNF